MSTWFDKRRAWNWKFAISAAGYRYEVFVGSGVKFYNGRRNNEKFAGSRNETSDASNISVVMKFQCGDENEIW